MFCTKCGQSFPDGSAACPFCGQPVAPMTPAQPAAPAAPVAAPVAPAAPQAPAAPAQPVDPNAYAQPQQPVYQQPVPGAAPVAPVAPSNPITYDIGGFLGQFFKDPSGAIFSRAEKKHWLLGLTFPVFYVIMNFIFKIINKETAITDFATLVNAFGVKGKDGPSVGGYAFSMLIVEALAIGVFLLMIFLLSNAFGVKKDDFQTIVAWNGLAFFPLAAASIICGFSEAIYIAMDAKVFNLTGVFSGVAFLFLILMSLEYFTKNLTQRGTRFKAIMLTITSSAIAQVAFVFFRWIDNKILF